jgi:hypothetical protein
MGLPFRRKRGIRGRGRLMEQMRLLDLREEEVALIELEAGFREEVVALMAAAIEAIVRSESEVDDELVDASEDSR